MWKGSSSGSKRRKKTEAQEEGGENRISVLPNAILVHILSFLPTKDAVRTTVLSKQWQYLWIHVPSLSFHLRLNCPSDALFADRTLTFHASPKIYDLKLIGPGGGPLVDRMVRFATTRHVEQLDLLLPAWSGYSLPRHLYSYECLRELKVWGCNLSPSGRVSWNSLRVLEVKYALWSDQDIANVLSGCAGLECLRLRYFMALNQVQLASPKLKTLALDSFWWDPNEDGNEHCKEMNIRAPHLEVLEVSGRWSHASLKLIDSGSLVSVALDFYTSEDGYDEAACRMLKHICEVARNAKQLRIGHHCLEVFLTMQPLPTSCCASLVVHILHNSNYRDEAMFNLLQCVPRVERLTVDFSEIAQPRQRPGFWRKQDAVPECLGCHLKVINVLRPKNNVRCLEFLKFLLKHGMVLEEMVVHKSTNSRVEDFHKLSRKLIILPRSSPRAVVLFPIRCHPGIKW